MTRPIPDRAPVKPRAIRENPFEDQYAVVVSFRVRPWPETTPDKIRQRLLDRIPEILAYRCDGVEALGVAVRVIGAQGEASRTEGIGP